jgi:hypothetical protein
MPNNTARSAPKRAPRARGEELWRLTHEGKVASCELRDDTAFDAGFEVIVRHDDEVVRGRRCLNEAIARDYANTFRQDYARAGWSQR